MSDERELWACADEMIRQHGTEAGAHAAARANALAEAGDQEGAAVWMLILHRIGQLKAAPPGTTH